MLKQKLASCVCGLAGLVCVASFSARPQAIPGRGQAPAPPQAYSITEVNAMFGPPGFTREIYRDGFKVLIDQTMPPSHPGSKGMHTRTLYDLKAHSSYTWDLLNPNVPCGGAVFEGDGGWEDPFVFAHKTAGEIATANPKVVGTEAVNGLTAKVLELSTPEMKAKLWLDQTHRLIVKMQMASGGGPYETRYEIKKADFSAPPPSLFALPKACAKTAAEPLPLTESQRIERATGGRAVDFANAIEPPLTAPPLNACTVLLRVIRAGTGEPVKSGFQVGLDTTSGQNNEKSEFGVGTDGRIHFLKGPFREVTDQIRDGILRIPNAPEQFNVYVHMIGDNGGGSALIYRQCWRPETVLLLAVDPEKPKPGEAPKPSDWLWAKAGKLATIAPPRASEPPRTNISGFQVTGVKAAEHTENYTASCPTEDMAFRWALTANGPGTATIRFTQETRTIRDETVEFSGPETKVVTYRATKMGAPGGHYRGWIGLEVLSPNQLSGEHEAYTMECAPRSK